MYTCVYNIYIYIYIYVSVPSTGETNACAFGWSGYDLAIFMNI